MQKKVNSRTLNIVLNVVLVVLIVLLIIEFNAYLSLLVTEKYEVESNILSCPKMYAKEKQEIQQKQNVRLLVMAISAVLWIITNIIKSFVKKKELKQTSDIKNRKDFTNNHTLQSQT